MLQKPRLFILDANALLHRAWHALPPLTNPRGEIVNAVYGVLSIMLKLLEAQKPDACVACWDTGEETFRDKAYAAYKAQREKQPDELYAQIPWTKEGLQHLGIESLEKDGFEADDVIATIAIQAQKKGWDVVIVTGDRDAFQLVRPGISVMAFKKGVTDTILYDEEEIQKMYGLSPAQFVDYKALRGDPSDNIPGVKGIGEKSATDLLRAFKSLSGILRAVHDSTSDISPSIRKKLLDAEKDLPGLVALVALVDDVPVHWEPKKDILEAVDSPAFVEFLMRMGFTSLVKRVGGGQKKSAVNVRGVLMVDDTEKADQAIQDLRGAKEIVVCAMRGAVDSLFAKTLDGFALGSGEKTLVFPVAFLRQQSKRKQELCSMLSDPALPKIAHDAKRETASFFSLGFEIQGWAFDTMLAAYLLSAGERNHDLPSVASRYLHQTVHEKDEAASMVAVIRDLAPVLKQELEQERLLSVFERFELPLIPVLFGMEQAGILIDCSYLAKLGKEMTNDRLALEKKMMRLVGREFNPASPIQLAEILFEDLKLSTKGIKRGKTGYSTAASELEKLRGVHPLIELIEEHREFSKLLSTYVDVLPTLADAQGRVHTTFHQAVTSTGRLSSSDPNLQNIPIRTELSRHIRRAFVAPKGYQLLSCDYSQIELRIVAALAKDERMLEAFRRGEDIHLATASSIWNIPKDEVTKDQRRLAKAINFGLIYGQGPQGLSQSAGISFADAKKFIDAYFDVYCGVKAYMEETKAMAHKLGYVETLFGHRRFVPEITSTLPQLRAQAERMAINMPVQGTSADLIKLAMIEIHQRLPEMCEQARLLLQVHDELVFEVPEKDVARVAKAMREIMETVEKIGVPIVVDAKAGKNWDEMEKVFF